MSSYAAELLRRQYMDLARNPPDGVSVGLGEDENIFNWELLIVGPPDTLYEGGFFTAKLDFPADFPNSPPVMTFKTPIWHPNVYEDGRVCISILHPPGEDQFNQQVQSLTFAMIDHVRDLLGYLVLQETSAERWRPILGVESIIISVISMLSDPNDDSPANIDAAVMWRNDKAAFKKRVREVVRRSQESM